MTIEQAEILDKALEKMPRDQEMGLEPVLQSSESAIELMVAAAAMVQALPAVPSPDPAQTRADRADFLARVEQLPAPVAPTHSPGFLAWLSQILLRGTRTGEQPRPLVLTFAKAVFVLVIILTASLGGTAVLATSALPTAPIYPAKLLVEEARLSMENSLAGEAALHLAFAEERVSELTRLTAMNRIPPEAQLENYNTHWRQAMQLAAEMPGEELNNILTQAQAMAGEQEKLLAQAQTVAAQQTQDRLQKAGRTLAQVQTAVQLGLQNQDRFRQQMRQIPENWPATSSNFGFGPGDCEEDCEEDRGFSPAPGAGPAGVDEPGSDRQDHDNAENETPQGGAPGIVDPGNEAPGASHPGSEDPLRNGPGNDVPGDEDPGNLGFGNHNPGSNQPANETPGNNSPGNGDIGGESPRNEDAGNDNTGPQSPGNEDSGNDSTGSQSPGNEDSGNDNDGGESPGNGDSGGGNPGNESPGGSDPGSTGDSGSADPGNDAPAQGDPDQEDPGQGDTGNDGPGGGNPGNDGAGGGNPGDNNPGGKR
jgi:hypothetical protein